MCGSMADIQSAAAEIRRGKKEEERTNHTWCGACANLECRSETCCARLAGNTGPKKSPKSRHLGTIAQLCRTIIFTTKACIDNGKKLVKQQYLLYMSPKYVNFGPLAAEIGPVVWGTPANFNGFRVLTALLHGTDKLCGVEQRSPPIIRQGGHHVGYWSTF